MKYLKQIIFITVVTFGLGLSFGVLADDGPQRPSCAEGFYPPVGGVGAWTEGPITCGFLRVGVYIDLRKFNDRFIPLLKTEDRDGEVEYIKLDTTIGVGSTRQAKTLFAVDKGYFNKKGGLEGIFSKTFVKAGNGSDSDHNVMEPKNPDELSKYSYTFIVSTDDKTLLPEGSKVNTVYTDGAKNYFKFSNDIYPFAETAYLECNNSNKCNEEITYVPESVVTGNRVILTRGKVVYVPGNIGKSVTYPIYNQVSTPTNGKANWKTYTNTQYGFRLQFPETWQGYTASSKENNLDNAQIEFNLSGQNKLFSIVTFTKSEWKDYQNGDLKPISFIAENKEYIFGYAQAQDYSDTNINRSKEIPEIISSFELVDGSMQSERLSVWQRFWGWLLRFF